MTDSPTCAWCDAVKQAGPTCPECGADYAKAAAIKQQGQVVQEAESEEERADISIERVVEAHELLKDPELEKRICIFALPAMLLGAWLVQFTGMFSNMQRIVFGMPVHELGHAMSSWLLGYNAIPTFWRTVTASSRGFLCPALLFLAIGLLANYGRKRGQPAWILLALLLWGVQLVGVFAFNTGTMQMLITFGGDAMGMILATALMLSFYVGKDTQLYKGAVRWGFLFIGAAAFMDIFMPWWRGQYDIRNIGYGMTGNLYTDSFLLVNQHGWGFEQLVNRHLLVGFLCMGVLAIAYGLGIRQSAIWIQQQEAAVQSDDDP